MLTYCNYKTEHSLGKGEVVSSILTGSTRNAHEMWAYERPKINLDTVRYGTTREHHAPTRAIFVESVP